MTSLPTLPLLVDALIADTAHMTVDEVGAHFRLLMFAWRSPGCCLPDDDARLARMLGVTAKRWAALKPAVMSLWVLSSSTYTNERLTREHQFVSAKVEKKRAAGRLGGRPKSLENNDQAKASGSSGEKQNESKPKAPTPTPTYTPIVPTGTEPDGFADFWSAYPSRDGDNPRKTALRAYAKAVRQGVQPSTILAAAQAYAAECRAKGKLGTEFVPQASTWLNQERFERFAGGAGPPGAKPPNGDAYIASLPADRWREEIRLWRSRGGHWPLRNRTPPPDDPATKVPPHILAEFGISHDRSLSELKLTGTG